MPHRREPPQVGGAPPSVSVSRVSFLSPMYFSGIGGFSSRSRRQSLRTPSTALSMKYQAWSAKQGVPHSNFLQHSASSVVFRGSDANKRAWQKGSCRSGQLQLGSAHAHSEWQQKPFPRCAAAVACAVNEEPHLLHHSVHPVRLLELGVLHPAGQRPEDCLEVLPADILRTQARDYGNCYKPVLPSASDARVSRRCSAAASPTPSISASSLRLLRCTRLFSPYLATANPTVHLRENRISSAQVLRRIDRMLAQAHQLSHECFFTRPSAAETMLRAGLATTIPRTAAGPGSNFLSPFRFRFPSGGVAGGRLALGEDPSSIL